MPASSTRAYEMRQRAQNVAATRQRIIDAAVRLHTSIGPAKTTISAIADVAGVTRATVYKHFADDVELYTACSGQWQADHPPPDPMPWFEIEDLDERTERIFTDLYGWYADNAQDLRALARDRDFGPPQVAADWQAMESAVVDMLAGSATGTVRAVAAHLVLFETWQSLAGRVRAADLPALALRMLRAAG